MIKGPTTQAKNTHWAWWVAVAALAAAVVIDAIDGSPLKLGTSVLLLTAALLAASFRPPRRKAVALGIVACAVAAALLLIYRIFGPGL